MIDDEIAKILSQVSADDLITDFINVDDIINNSNKILENMTSQQMNAIVNDEDIQSKIAKLLSEVDSNTTNDGNTKAPLITNTINTESVNINNIGEKEPIMVNSDTYNANANLNSNNNKEVNNNSNNPLDFIQLIEIDTMKDTSIQKDESVFQLHHYAKKNKIMFDVFEFREKKKLYHNMTKHKIKMTCMTAYDEAVFGGFSNGVIKLFSCVKETEIKSFSIQEEIGSVMAIDCSDDSNYVIAGYQNGYSIVWNTASLKPIKVVNELYTTDPEAANKKIIAIKFIKSIPGYYYYYITSDECGKVRKYTVGEGYVRTTAQIDLLVDGTNPFFLLQVMKVSEEDQKTYPQFSKLKNTIVVLGNTDGVKVLYLNPETSNECHQSDLFTSTSTSTSALGLGAGVASTSSIQNLNYEMQDASFGIGYTSFFADSNGNDALKLGRRKKHHGLQFSKEQMLFALSIDKYIFLYVVPVIKQKVELILPVGKYTCSNSIIRLSFFSLSILFYLDKDKTVKVLNTKEIQNEDIINQDDAYHYNNTNKDFGGGDYDDDYEYSEQTKDQLIPEIESTSLSLDFNKSILRKHFYNYIISYPKRILVFTKSTFHSAALFNWKDCLDKLTSQDKWEEAFCLGISIYRGKITSLADIPIQEMIRKANIGTNLKKLIERFLTMHLKGSGKDNQIENIDNKALMKKLINFSIEFCIEIEAFDYLIKSIQVDYFPLMKGFFFENLNQFILSDILSNQKLDLRTITTIVNPLLEKKNFYLFSKILYHLDRDSICNCHYLQSTCEEYKIITALIYISTNKSNEDYFFPIPHIFAKYLSSIDTSQDNDNNDYRSYEDYYKMMTINSNDVSIMKELENSRQYNGHKLLWYCDLCLKGKKYPKMTSIPEDKYNKLIPQIYFFLLSLNVLTKMLEFDSFSFFKVISQFFLNEKILKLIVSIDNSTYQSISSTYNLKYYNGININKIEQLTIIDMLIQICKEKDNFYINHDLNEFLVLLSFKMTIDKTLLLSSTRSIIGYHQKLKGLSPDKAYDRFNCHYSLLIPNSIYVRDLSDYINNLIDSIDNLQQDEFDDLLNVSQFSSFILIRVHLLEKSGQYLHCVDVYIHCNIKEIEKDVFGFILNAFDKVEIDNNVDAFYDFKKGVLERFDQLAELSIEEVTRLAFIRYKKEIDMTIRQLDSKPAIQLSFLESVINEKLKEDEQQQQGLHYQSHQDDLNKMLVYHIELIIKLGEKDQIIKILNDRPIYPLKDCLSLCLSNNIINAAIYIYQRMGNYLSALQLSLDQLRKIYDQISKYISSNETASTKGLSSSSGSASASTSATASTYKWSQLLEDLRKNIRLSESICEKSTDKESAKEEEIDQLWLTFINELYSLSTKLEKEKSNPELEIMKIALGVEIENVLKKMICYVSIQKILSRVSINFKPEQFVEFKALLHKMLTSFSRLTNVLLSAQNLLTHSIRYQVNDFKKLNTQGEYFKWYKCDGCHRPMKKNSEERAIIFKCRHMFHYPCLNKHEEQEGQSDQMVVCKVCGELEDEPSQRTLKRRKSLVSQKNVTSYINDGVNKQIGRRREGHLLGRLTALDNDYINKSSRLK